MTQFAYKARAHDGSPVRGYREADDSIDLSRRLRAEGLFLVEAGPVRAPLLQRFRGRGLSPSELMMFTFHLRTLLEAGVPLLAGLGDLEGHTRKASTRRIIREVGESISGGSSLAQALDRHPRAFPTPYRGMVRAGESTGRLVESLERVLALLEWRQELKGQIRQLTTYPIIVFSALIGLAVLALVWVIPRFEAILTAVEGKMPLPTRILLGLSSLLLNHWPYLVAALAAAVAAWIILRRIAVTRLFTDAAVLKIPFIGRLTLVTGMSQIVHFLAAGIDTGLGLPDSLDMAAGSIENRSLRGSVLRVQHLVIGGESLAGAMEKAGGFPSLVRRMVAIGESSGSLVETLRRAETVYDRELPAAIKRFAAAFEPAITLVMGGALLFLLLSVLLPLYRIYETMGGAQ